MTNLEFVYQTIARKLDEEGIAAGALSPSSELASLGLDSLAFVEIVYEIETHFGIEVDEELLEDAATLESFLGILRKSGLSFPAAAAAS